MQSMYKIILSVVLMTTLGCSLPLPQKGSEMFIEATEKVEVVNNNQQVPKWALWAMGGGIFCFALIIPSPFRFKGFS